MIETIRYAIYYTLNTEYASVAGYEIVQPNEEFSQSVPYLFLSLVPSNTQSITLAGDDSIHIGQARINIVIGAGDGVSQAYDIAKELSKVFYNNRWLSFDGQTIAITSPLSVLVGEQSDGVFTLPVSFNYRVDEV